ncbi:hypothetical protein HG531_010826 [Fusarium graminearum]|nr:hypothetical protein HG531_010826 [Fusarium graminearum]
MAITAAAIPAPIPAFAATGIPTSPSSSSSLSSSVASDLELGVLDGASSSFQNPVQDWFQSFPPFVTVSSISPIVTGVYTATHVGSDESVLEKCAPQNPSVAAVDVAWEVRYRFVDERCFEGQVQVHERDADFDRVGIGCRDELKAKCRSGRDDLLVLVRFGVPKVQAEVFAELDREMGGDVITGRLGKCQVW